MSPRHGMLAACACATAGGVAMVAIGIARPGTGEPIGLMGLVVIYGSAMCALDAWGRK